TNIKYDVNYEYDPNTEDRLRHDALRLSINAAVVKPLPATRVFGRLHQQSL
ncbi:hypothetical protein E4U16_005775, partial [Claviceps sp. LM84 group G4]